MATSRLVTLPLLFGSVFSHSFEPYVKAQEGNEKQSHQQFHHPLQECLTH